MPGAEARADDGQSQPFFSVDQRKLLSTLADDDRCTVRHHPDQLRVKFRGAARFGEVQRERSEDLLVRIEDRRRPPGPQAVAQRNFAVIDPQRIACDVFDDHRFASIHGGAARPGAFADRFAVDRPTKFDRQAGRGKVVHVRAIGIEQQNRAQHARRLRLDDAQQRIERLLERSALGHELVYLRLTGHQRFVALLVGDVDVRAQHLRHLAVRVELRARLSEYPSVAAVLVTKAEFDAAFMRRAVDASAHRREHTLSIVRMDPVVPFRIRIGDFGVGVSDLTLPLGRVADAIRLEVPIEETDIARAHRLAKRTERAGELLGLDCDALAQHPIPDHEHQVEHQGDFGNDREVV
jgi:hypothetical protein